VKIATSAKQMISRSFAVALFAPEWEKEGNTWQAHGTAWWVDRSSRARFFVCFIAPRSCRAWVQNYPTQQNEQRIVRVYWQLLSEDWPFV